MAVGYVRRSKAADAKVVSLEVQRAAIEGYCAAQGWRLAGLLEHDGVSGGKRSRFAQMDAAIKAHGARFIVAYHLDRTARDCAGFLDWCEALPKRGVELHVVGRGNVEVKSSAGYLANGVEALVAAHYRKLVSEKTSDALQRIKAQGRRWGNDAPYGTTWQDGRAVPNPAEMKVLAQVARMHKAGLKLRGISAKLAAAGVLNRQGRVFHPATIARMLQQRSK